MSTDLTEYFAGTKLYGDDFSLEEIAAWFKDEAEAYPDRRASGGSTYAFTELNHHHGYRFLSGQPIDHALGLGGATGDELLPIIRSVRRITILDPSVPAAADELAGVPCR